MNQYRSAENGPHKTATNQSIGNRYRYEDGTINRFVTYIDTTIPDYNTQDPRYRIETDIDKQKR